MFDDCCIAITGGTGSFGSAFASKLLQNPNVGEIIIFSRDELKQHEMRVALNDPRVRFVIGDVRDRNSLEDGLLGCDYIFHAAALKQVPSCEFFPLEALRTNVLGTENLLRAACKLRVKKIVCLSTDKAVYPINAMGMSKGMMEKVVTSFGHLLEQSGVVACCTRYGNVLASRGSVVPHFFHQISLGQKLTVTDPRMTRFMMTLAESVDLVEHAFEHAHQGEIWVKKSPAATIEDIAKAVLRISGYDEGFFDVVGARCGEKLFETLAGREELAKARDRGSFLSIPNVDAQMDYESFYDSSGLSLEDGSDYNSDIAPRLSRSELVALFEANYSGHAREKVK